jgi:hypothetical protein
MKFWRSQNFSAGRHPCSTAWHEAPLIATAAATRPTNIKSSLRDGFCFPHFLHETNEPLREKIPFQTSTEIAVEILHESLSDSFRMTNLGSSDS